MKKIFTSVLFAMCAFIGLSAQSFEFRMNGEKVEDGATVTFNGTKHIIKPQYEYKTKDILSLHNLTANAIKYSAEIVVLRTQWRPLAYRFVWVDNVMFLMETHLAMLQLRPYLPMAVLLLCSMLILS